MSDYTPRLSAAGIRYDYKWYSDNPLYLAGYGMPNCTAYAWGRFWEIAGGTSARKPTLSTGNAEDWYSHTSDGYTRNRRTPKLGAIACYRDGIYSGYGHVAVVEAIYQDGSFLVSESAYEGYFFRATHICQANGTYDDVSGYVFQGFIYNPYAGDTPSPDPPVTGGNLKWWLSNYQLKVMEGGGFIL